MDSQVKSRFSSEFPVENLTQAEIEQIYRTRQAIMARAKHTVDPEGKGIDFLMNGTDDGSFFGVTEEGEFEDWLHWAEQLIEIISIVSQRIGLAAMTIGLAFAGSNMLDKERTANFGLATLGIAALFAVWFIVANLAKPSRT